MIIELRDQIAIEAMKLLLKDTMTSSMSTERKKQACENIGEASYIIADNMLKAKEQSK